MTKDAHAATPTVSGEVMLEILNRLREPQDDCEHPASAERKSAYHAALDDVEEELANLAATPAVGGEDKEADELAAMPYEFPAAAQPASPLRCQDCGQELPIRYPCYEQGCAIKCRF